MAAIKHCESEESHPISLPVPPSSQSSQSSQSLLIHITREYYTEISDPLSYKDIATKTNQSCDV